jgi:hypothetical protein
MTHQNNGLTIGNTRLVASLTTGLLDDDPAAVPAR